MTTTQKTTSVQSNEELAKLADGTVVLQAKYSFQNAYSINGPFGTLSVILLEEPTGQGAIGQVMIQTLFGAGTETNLQYTGTSNFNPSTGYTIVSAIGKGTMQAWPNPPQPVTAKIEFTLEPGYNSGELTVQNFLQGYALTPTSVQVGN